VGRACQTRIYGALTSVGAWEDLAVEVHEGSGPYVLFVHGFLSSRAHWIPNVGPLSDVCRPVVVEQYGHGNAATLDDPARLTPQGYSRAFDEVRARLGVERWFVVGHSLGGALTIRYAIENPARVCGHVFTNSQSAFADQAWIADVVQSSAELASRLEGPDGRSVLDEHPMHPRNARRMGNEVREALTEDFQRHDPVGVAGQMRHTLPGSSVRSIASINTRPALLTIGTDEAAFVDTATHVVDVMPRLETVAFAAGHNVNLHQPADWNAAVGDFINRHG
jgi:2-succinyl-6-hydroxy-2,4-cyclohexadiene-1-carboxylate synthase